VLSPVVLALFAASHAKVEGMEFVVREKFKAIPLQIEVEEALVIEGFGFTVTVTVLAAETQPEVVPVTVYTVVLVGMTLTVDVFTPPAFALQV
jgi:hypothetical protein